ncbi:cytochrome b562 [Rosenbergiella australiborealis]|uniref:Cytochrome b562 n=1 Tax=Rosenbergiella australiborealis TaxID=1544696 RepID=A0ABS5T153_9GAMM|nr:cytochrome b562 [Rosenbergiella australiborealis]MBT0726080.1 cytochrome b562 [Rosenbergiella australiborealis]
MRTVSLVILSTTLLCSALSLSAQAADLEGDMMSLSDGLSTVTSSNNNQAMQQALTDMRHAAEDAKTATPPSLAGSAPQSPAMQGWRSAFDQLLGKISQADQLVKQGKLTEAKQVAQQIAVLRNENHRKYR